MCFYWLTTELWRCMFIGQYIIPVIKLLIDVKETNVFFSLLLRSLVQYGRLLLQFKNCSPSICVENGHLFLSFFWILLLLTQDFYLFDLLRSVITILYDVWIIPHLPTRVWLSPCQGSLSCGHPLAFCYKLSILILCFACFWLAFGVYFDKEFYLATKIWDQRSSLQPIYHYF